MSNAQYQIPNSARGDASAFSVPGDEDGGANDNSFQVENPADGQARHWYIHVDNGWDQNVDITVQGSHYLDSAMSSAVDDGTTETINSDATGAFDGETGHTFLQIDVDPASAPTSGDLTVTFQSREE